jgi:hypothetical protein
MKRGVLVLEIIERVGPASLTSCGAEDYVGRCFYKGSHFLEGGFG